MESICFFPIFAFYSASDDELGEAVSQATISKDKSDFSLLSYTMTAGSAVSEASNSNAENNEKLVCKILPAGQLMLTHKNVISDEGTNVKFATQLVGNNILVLQNCLERIRKKVINKVLSIKRISEFLNFPILAQPTLKKI